MKLQTSQIIGGRFIILYPIGQGGFGETYVAEDRQGKNKKCVVKCFSFSSNNQQIFEKAKSLFQRESDVLFRLTELNGDSSLLIPHFLAYFEEDNRFYLVQDFIQGTTIREEITQKGQLSESEVIILLKDVLKTLQIIHDNHVIHRDIKPDNLIKRTKDNQVFLIDFGAVKEKITQLTQVGTNIQTIGYAPLEQYHGNPQYNSDIYALGITAIEALTGLSPATFQSSHLDSFINSNQLNINPKLKKVLSKMVAVDYKNDRYQSANDVLRDLERITSNLKSTQLLQPTKISISNHFTLVKGHSQKFKRVIIPVSLGMMCLSAISMIALLLKLWINPTPSTQIREFRNVPPSSSETKPPIRFRKVEPLTPEASSSVEDNKAQTETPIRFKKVNPD